MDTILLYANLYQHVNILYTLKDIIYLLSRFHYRMSHIYLLYMKKLKIIAHKNIRRSIMSISKTYLPPTTVKCVPSR